MQDNKKVAINTNFKDKTKITLKFEYIYVSLFLLTFLLVFKEIETPVGALRAIVITSFLYFILFYREKIYGKQFLVLFAFLFLYSIVAFLYTGFFSIKTLSQIIFLTTSLVFLYNIFIKLGLIKVYRSYIFLSIFISIGILLQHLGYYLGIPFLYDLSYLINGYKVVTEAGVYRAHFIFSEPAIISYMLALAFVMSFYSILNKNKLLHLYIKKKYAFLIIIAYLSTFSSLGYIVLILTIFSIIRMRMKSILLFLFFAILGYIFLINNANYMYRVDGFLTLFNDEDMSVAKMNMSIWAMYSNMIIAFNNFTEYFPIGVGMANHATSFDQYSYLLNHVTNLRGIILMKEGAGGLMLRITSEVGFIGILSIFYFLVVFKVNKKNNLDLYLLSNAFLIGIIVILIRHGGLISSMTTFYFLGYYFVGKHKDEGVNLFKKNLT